MADPLDSTTKTFNDSDDDAELGMAPVYVGKNAIKEPSTASQSEAPSKTLQPSASKAKTLAKDASKTGIKNKKSKTKEKSILTNKFKALLAANLKKHSLG